MCSCQWSGPTKCILESLITTKYISLLKRYKNVYIAVMYFEHEIKAAEFIMDMFHFISV